MSEDRSHTNLINEDMSHSKEEIPIQQNRKTNLSQTKQKDLTKKINIDVTIKKPELKNERIDSDWSDEIE